MSEETLYLDASALAKLVLSESESQALLDRVRGARLLTSVIGEVETRRALRLAGGEEALLDDALTGVTRIEIGNAIRRDAGTVEPARLRTLDAIHLATALLLKPELTAFVVYDRRLADAASALGLPVVSPGAAA